MISKTRSELQERIQNFINDPGDKDTRFMRALLVVTMINNVKPGSYTIKHINLSDKHEQYIVTEDPVRPEDRWRNKELNLALQAGIDLVKNRKVANQISNIMVNRFGFRKSRRRVNGEIKRGYIKV